MSTSAHQRARDAVHAVMIRFFMNAESESLDILRSIDLSMSQSKCLIDLRCSPGPRPISDVAESIHLSAAATGRVVDHLVGEELVVRKESEVDRRIKLVELTDHGRDITEAYMQAKANRINEILSELTEDQCEALAIALSPLILTATERNTNHDC